MNKLTKYILVAFFIGIVVFVMDNGLSGGFNYSSINHLLINFGIYQLYSFVIGFSNMYFFDYLDKHNWKEGEQKKRVIFGFIGSVIITLCCLFFLNMFTDTVISGQSLESFIKNETIEKYQFVLWITLSVVSIFHIIYYYNAYQQNKIKEQKVIAGTASAKFDALKNQLDPHFLFNSLNVLTSLIEENPENAQRFTTSLSKVYRYVLEQKNKELVTVDEELNFARTYMSLLKMRFEDSIIFEIPDSASNPESKVVPLSLQLLLENAVKHNMVTSNKPLHIKIYEDKGNLVVLNNLQLKQIVKKSTGVGLSNIKQRYELLTNRKIIINQEAKSFAIAIPMLTKQVTIMRKQLTASSANNSYVRARKRVEEVKEFYYGVISYIIVIPFLIFVNWWTSWNYQWFWWPMFGWGIGIAFHAYKVYVNDGVLGRSWEEGQIKKYMKEEDEQNRWN